MIPGIASDAVSGGLSVATPPGGGTTYGQRSLALNVDGTTGGTNAGIKVEFCGGSLATGIFGVLHAMIWFKPTDGGGALAGPGYLYLYDNSTSIVGGDDTNTPANGWFEVHSHGVMGASVKHAELTVSGISGRKGVLYFDNIYFD